MRILFIASLLVATEGGGYSSQRHINSFGSSSAQRNANTLFRQESGNIGSGGTNNAGVFFGHSATNTGVFSGQNTGRNFASSSHRGNQRRPSFNHRVNNARNFAVGGSRCRDGEVLHVDGNCVVPKIIRNFYSFTVPQQPRNLGSRPIIPPPKEEHNILFIRLPEGVAGGDHIVVPPPRQNNIVYILKKNSGISGNVIDIPAPPKTNPEVFFVNYNPNENPTLPGGIDLQTALDAASQGTGQVIGTSNSNNVQSFSSDAQVGQSFVSGSSNFGTSSLDAIGNSHFGTSISGDSGASNPGVLGGSNFGISTSSDIFGSVNFLASGPESTGSSFVSSPQPSQLYSTP